MREWHQQRASDGMFAVNVAGARSPGLNKPLQSRRMTSARGYRPGGHKTNPISCVWERSKGLVVL